LQPSSQSSLLIQIYMRKKKGKEGERWPPTDLQYILLLLPHLFSKEEERGGMEGKGGEGKKKENYFIFV